MRPDAIFLIAALALMALTGPRGSRLGNAAKDYCALAGPAAYQIYLTVHTGSWQAWAKAKAGWDLHLVTPIQALKTSWWAAFRHPYSAAYAFGAQLELAAMTTILLATLAFLCWRRWPEAAVLRARRARARHPDLVPKLPRAPCWCCSRSGSRLPGLTRASPGCDTCTSASARRLPPWWGCCS